MRFNWVLLLFVASALSGSDVLNVFGRQWTVVNGSDWKIVDQEGGQVLQLITGREPEPGPRRPTQFALAHTPAFSNVEVELDVRPRQKSLMLVFAYRDPAHFNYAHLSTDTGLKQPVHNGIFHVFGGERVRISSQEGPPAFAETGRWYHVILRHDGATGAVQVSVDGRQIQALHAVDLSITSGSVGIGSFDETGDFRNVKITGS